MKQKHWWHCLSKQERQELTNIYNHYYDYPYDERCEVHVATLPFLNEQKLLQAAFWHGGGKGKLYNKLLSLGFQFRYAM